MRWLALVLATGCGFAAQSAGTAGDAPRAPDAHPDARIDAAILPDAPVGPDARRPPSDCPATYDIDLGTGSLYRNSDDDSSAGDRTHHASTAYDHCNEDSTGATHLLALDDATELAALLPHLTAGNTYYIGGTQLRDQAAPADGWIKITDATPAAFFVNWRPTQPDDKDGDENNSQNYLVLSPDGFEDDEAGDTSRSFLCECDDKAIDPAFATAWDAN